MSKKCNRMTGIIRNIAFWICSLAIPVFGQSGEVPNILIIMTDQQAWDAVGYSGNKAILTPNLDRLAKEGGELQSRRDTVPGLCSRTYLRTHRTPDRDHHHPVKRGCEDR